MFGMRVLNLTLRRSYTSILTIGLQITGLRPFYEIEREKIVSVSRVGLNSLELRRIFSYCSGFMAHCSFLTGENQ